ncbi:MAG: hypothetical protein EOO28_20675 [Comamonadaceae bacterium]|nr:MAG: hypothetical protein EOO28_20675 [Comamonadaceae bacterium]
MEAKSQNTNELIIWLKAVDLPTWAKTLLVLVMMGMLAGAGTIMTQGFYHRDKDEISAATTLLTISLPVLLVVIALVFGTNGEKALQKRTARVLDVLLPQCIVNAIASSRENGPGASGAPASAAPVTVKTTRNGCMADYTVRVQLPGGAAPASFDFSVELNVRKVNFVCWIPAPEAGFPAELDAAKLPALIGHHRAHTASGALSEGYALNPSPVHGVQAGKAMLGLVFIKTLPRDFLLESQETLYFAQDLAFFVRSMVDAPQGRSVGHGV